MNRISEITKRDILDIFRNGIERDEIFQTITMVYPYYGRVEEIDFLKRLYELDKSPCKQSETAGLGFQYSKVNINRTKCPV